MSSPELVRHEDAGALAADVATRFLALVEELQAAGRRPDVVLTGGTIADAIHREIARLAPDAAVDWARVRFWWGDERFVPEGSADRNAGQARAALLDAVGASDVHEMAPSDAGLSLEQAAVAYGDEIRATDAGYFDLVMLGMGPDGHVASLFPGFPQVAVDDTIAVPVTGSPKPPPERISLTVPALCRSTRVWFVVSGPEKAEAAARAVAGDQELPAAHVSGEQETVWFLA